jgi:hypothetical protein
MAGRIFQSDGFIYLCANGLTVKVQSSEYHQRMNHWIENRMGAPLLFMDNGTTCTMRAPAGGGDVEVELTKETK